MISNVIALIVAAILIVSCTCLALRVVIRGRFETSGYVVDWKTNPVSMIIYVLCLVSCPVVIVWGLLTQWPSSADIPQDQYRVFVEIRPDARPHFRYEGPGVDRALSITKDDAGDTRFSFSAMTLPPGTLWELDGINDLPKYRVFDFIGSISCLHGKYRLLGEIQSREHGELIVLGADEKVVLRPGKNHIAIEGHF
jgi:hypothetical protein